MLRAALLFGVCIDLFLRDSRILPHPVVLLGWLASCGERILRRIFPATENGERAAGCVVVCAVCAAAYGIPAYVLSLVSDISQAASFILQAFWAFQIPAVRGLCSACLCVACYLVAGLSGSPLLSLVACAVTGLSVALMWPGTYSLAARKLPGGGTVLFAILAFFGDIGCSAGPALIGMIAGTEGEGLHRGILLSAVFPAVMVCGSLFLLRRRKRTK